jgi:hypothetical protein
MRTSEISLRAIRLPASLDLRYSDHAGAAREEDFTIESGQIHDGNQA